MKFSQIKTIFFIKVAKLLIYFAESFIKIDFKLLVCEINFIFI